MARPGECCYDPGAELAGDPISPNVCDVNWYAWANVKVVLTTWVDSVEIELAETDTDENGVYLFSDVPPAKNYIITAICPTDKKFVIKDVAEEVVGGETYDAGVAGAESTVLALCLEGLGEIGSDSYLLDLDDFQSHSDYNKVIEEVCDYLANCEHAIPSWVSVLTGLSPGYAPPEEEEEEEFIGGGGFGGGYVPTPTPTTYTVNYDGNGNTDGDVPVDANLYEEGALVTVLDNTGTLEKTGSTFDGWNTASDGSGDNYVAGNSFAMGTDDVTLFAKWEIIPTHTVTYDGNDETSGTVPADANLYEEGALVTVLGQGSLVRDGYTFDGWNTAADGSETSYAALDTFNMGTADVTLFAKWECDPCSTDGWVATDVLVEKYYATGSTGNSEPRVDVSGTISSPDCLTGDIEITLQVVLYTDDGVVEKGRVEKTLTLDNTFIETFSFPELDNASYNSVALYKLILQPDGCSNWIQIATGSVIDRVEQL
jgi:uncharacterized repeat protein (TIGR02543 family)